ncbi:MAG: DNRLRE domain-containing protein [Chloroflexota bacterium]
MLLVLAQPCQVAALAPEGLYTLRQRLGVNVAPGFAGVPSFPGLISDYPGVEELGLGWYSDWSVREAPPRPQGIEYAQLVQTRAWPPDWARLERAARANPGALWIIGNEPETRGQGQHTPQEYARRYHEAHTAIKRADPNAQVAIGGVVMPTPLRLRWLDLCLAAYQDLYGRPMPVDVWNIHVQILQEKRDDWGCGIPYGLTEDEGRLYQIVDNANAAAFQQLVTEFCAWLVQRGQRDKPLIISEYGVLMPSDYLPGGDQAVLDFMRDTFDWLLTARDPRLGYAADDHRLVQRWLWFSLNFPFYEHTPGGFNGALYHWQHPDQLTVFGAFWRDYVRALRFEEATLPAVADTYVDPARPGQAFGGRGRLRVRADAAGYAIASLVRFDLAPLPTDAVLAEATLRVRVVHRSNRQSLNLRVAPAGTAWDEGLTHAAWARPAPPGGEAYAAVLGPETDVAEVDITPLVQRWLAGSLRNEGLLLEADPTVPGGNVAYDLGAREWAEGAPAAPTLRVRYLTRQP